ncbi:hypothetical protein DSO57_1009846 [Entomophthora muscae]|uniref:Uncharacterized protein n=1 Tax=Entomophthora muscae TaxID=34485 RepID=A0ACC2TUA7_9FUNG|nr:hypothetical protein DSO57_1009846 [Entomophthora muscae]
MLFKTWEEWKTKAKQCFVGYEPDPRHLLNQVKIQQFTALQPFIVKLQEYANKVLAQQIKGTSGNECRIITDNFHSLVRIPNFENAPTHNYAGLILEREQDEEAKATLKWNPFPPVFKKKEPSIDETNEAKFKDMQTKFEAIYLAHKRPNCPSCTSQGPYVFTSNCYNCGNQGHKLDWCSKPCYICKSADHSNFSCNHCLQDGTQQPVTVIMAEKFYQNEKHLLSTPEGASPLNKKNNSNYIIERNGPTLSHLIKARIVRYRGPSPLHDHTLPPLKRYGREANPSPEEHPVKSSATSSSETQSTFSCTMRFLNKASMRLPLLPHCYHPLSLPSTADETLSTPIPLLPWRSNWTLMPHCWLRKTTDTMWSLWRQCLRLHPIRATATMMLSQIWKLNR